MDPSGSRVGIRRAASDEAGVLEQIEADSFDGDRLSRRSLRHHLQSPTSDVFVATLGGEVAGYAMMFYRAKSRIGRLYSIATVAAARGNGVGRRLVEACEAAARKRGCAALRLEVRQDNPGAIQLYRRLGYVEFGTYDDYYEDGEPALRFEKPLIAGEPLSGNGVRAA